MSLLLLCPGLMLAADSPPAPDWGWVQQISGSQLGWPKGQHLTIDKAGNLYLTGGFSGTARFGTTNVTGSGANLFVAKFDPNGQPVWISHAGATRLAVAEGRSVAVDSAGNVYVAGVFSDALDFGETNISNGFFTWYEAFLAKYDHRGRFQWVWQGNSGESSHSSCNAMTVDANDHIIVGGHLHPGITIGAYRLDTHNDAYLAKFDGAGHVLWAQSIGLIGGESRWNEVNDITSDSAGNIFVTGSFYDQARFGTLHQNGGTNLTSRGTSDIYTAKFTSAGYLLWVRQAGCLTDGADNDDPWDYGRGITIDPAGNVFVAGSFTLPGASFGTTNLVTGQNHELFLAKYDPSGALAWARKSPDGRGAATSVKVDAAGDLYVSILALTLPLVQKYDHNGNFLWAQGASAGNPSAFDLELGRDGSVYIAGTFYQHLSLGTFSLTNTNRTDMFIAKLGSSLPHLSIATSESAITLAWPVAVDRYEPVSAPTADSSTWSPVNATLQTNGVHRTVTFPRPNTNEFYRLRKLPLN